MMEKKILLIDDSEEIHESIGNFLEEKGYRVYHSFDGEEGIENIFKIIPDCVILEILLPKKLGVEILRECKINPKTEKIPFIFHTILYFKEDEIKKGIILRGRFYPVKIDAYFQKGTNPEIILRKIKELTGEIKEKREKKGKILLIEDDIETASILKRIFEENNYILEHITTGKEGIEKIREFKPDLILLDYILPDTDGIEMLRRIKEKYEEMPVIMMTAYGSQDLAVHLLKKGADDYISKPVASMREILLKVEENIKKAKESKKFLMTSVKEMNEYIIDIYFKKEEIEKKLAFFEKEFEKICDKKVEEFKEKCSKMRENIMLIKNDMDLLIEKFGKALSDIKEKFANLKPGEEDFPEKVKEDLQCIEVLIYKIKDKISKL
ncbi:MAG: response regulator [candidate division WOR-3 bacterium]